MPIQNVISDCEARKEEHCGEYYQMRDHMRMLQGGLTTTIGIFTVTSTVSALSLLQAHPPRHLTRAMAGLSACTALVAYAAQRGMPSKMDDMVRKCTTCQSYTSLHSKFTMQNIKNPANVARFQRLAEKKAALDDAHRSGPPLSYNEWWIKCDYAPSCACAD